MFEQGKLKITAVEGLIRQMQMQMLQLPLGIQNRPQESTSFRQLLRDLSILLQQALT